MKHQHAAGLVVAAGLVGEVQRVHGRKRVQTADAGLAHEELAGGQEQAVPDRRRIDARVEKLNHAVRGFGG